MSSRTIARWTLLVALTVLLLVSTAGSALATDVTRYQQDAPGFAYTGTWNNFSNVNYSGGSYTYVTQANGPGATADYSFNGTGIDWLTVKYINQGIAQVWVDSEAPTTVDLYKVAPQAYQQVVFSRTGLTNGPHVLHIRHNGTHNAAASSPYAVGIDAVDVYTEPDLTITASAGAGGSISPNGATSVVYGADSTYTFDPDDGYHVADVLVDGVSVGAPANYTFDDVTANHTISVSFGEDPVVSTGATSALSLLLLGGLSAVVVAFVRRGSLK